MRLDKRQTKIAAAASVAIIILGVYIFFLKPIIMDLKAKHIECRECEDKALNAREFIESVKLTWVKEAVLTEKDVSYALDELTRHGKTKSVEYVSITPKEDQTKRQAQYDIMPIDIELESRYEDLGKFLGSLGSLEGSLVTVRSFKIRPKGASGHSAGPDPARLVSKLTIDMYLLGQKYAE